MGKHLILKFKVSKIISTFKSCRSKHPSSLPSNPIPSSFLRLNSALTKTTHTNNKSPPREIKPRHFSLKRHVSSAIVSARRSFSSSRPSHDSSSLSRFKWEKHSHWHVIAKIPDDFGNYDSTPPRRKIYNSSASDYESNPPPRKLKHSKRRRRKVRISSSSDSGVFSDAAEETDISTPFRRRRFSRKSVDKVAGSPARLSEFMRKVIRCKAEEEVVEGKVRESFAVVKRSEDPYEDFRKSMAEMVVEKEMFEKTELEELLRCFLSLNSEHLHGVIVRAFVDIWESLFCRSPSLPGISTLENEIARHQKNVTNVE